jgi:hypothetical protein
MVDCVFKLETKSNEDEAMVFINIDAPGNSFNRHAVRTIQKSAGAAERKAAAEARRARRKAKRVPGLASRPIWSTACDSMADLDLPPTSP